MSKARSSFFDGVDRIVEVIVKLRGNFYNKLSYFVIASGVFLCGEFFWAPFLEAAVEKQFDIQISTNSAPWVGIILVMLGLTYHYLREKSQSGELSFSDADQREHDAQNLAFLLESSTFAEVRSSLNWIDTHDAYFDNHKEHIVRHVTFLEREENKFLDEKILAAAYNYQKKLNCVWEFWSQHFFVYPEHEIGSGGFQCCLYPDWICDRLGGGTPEEDRKYQEKSNELHKTIVAATESQVTFIAALKKSLGSQFHYSLVP